MKPEASLLMLDNQQLLPQICWQGLLGWHRSNGAAAAPASD